MCKGRVKNNQDVWKNPHADREIRRLAGKQVTFGPGDIKKVEGDPKKPGDCVVLVEVKCTDTEGGGIIGLGIIEGLTDKDQKEINDIKREALQKFL